MKCKFLYLNIVVALFCIKHVKGQPAPGNDEKIPYLVTFGEDGDEVHGDDDFCQVFFAVIPKEIKKAFFIRVYDPDVGGALDEKIGTFNSKVKISVYGGKGAISHDDSKNVDPVGNYKAGILLKSKIFGVNEQYDQDWYSFGPFNPLEGELQEEFGGYVFKIIVEGIEGNDGNLYKFFLSNKPQSNKPLEGANLFTYEYTFRLHKEAGSVSHIYPFVTEDVTAVKINTFDFDNDGMIRLVSVAKKGEKVNSSGNGNWSTSKHQIVEEEKKTSLDIQIVKLKAMENNNMVLYITNQYGERMPFYTAPIGGIPKYKYEIGVK